MKHVCSPPPSQKCDIEPSLHLCNVVHSHWRTFHALMCSSPKQHHCDRGVNLRRAPFFYAREKHLQGSFGVLCTVTNLVNDDDQWRYSADRALASLTGFMIVCSSTMWGYQLHDRPVQDTLIQPVVVLVTTRDSRGEAGKHGREMASEFFRRAPVVLAGFFYMP
jgi:hypothetical protein